MFELEDTMTLTLATLDDVCQLLGEAPPSLDEWIGVKGFGWHELRGEDGELKELGTFRNRVTDAGDELIAERAFAISSPPGLPTGLRLGKGTGAPAKNGANSFINTYVSAITASKAIDGGFPTSTGIVAGAGTTIAFRTSWAAGEATQNGWAEVAMTNENPLTDIAGVAANTVARALFSSAFDKTVSDTLAVTWNILILGA